MTLSVFDSIVILLIIAFTITVICRKLKVPVIIGYILVGILVGPHALGWIVDTQTTKEIAEFGILFLMFTIGLEFSFSRIMTMKKNVFIFGGLQVVITTLMTTAIGVQIGLSFPQSFIVGAIVAMSSTAIVTKQLADQGEINSSHGMASIGVLLFQDLAVIPLLIIVPSLVITNHHPLILDLSWALVKGVLAIIIILAAGRWVLRPLFFKIAQTYSMELFTLTALLVTLGTAWFTHHLGLSLALGGFLAGMMLGETEFRHQIESDIRPFRDVLLGFFFISAGMQFNTAIVLNAWNWVLLLLAALIIFKVILIIVLGKAIKLPTQVATRTSVILAHGGEFGIAILALAISYNLFPKDYDQVILGALLLSMIIAPLFISFSRNLVKLFPEKIDFSEPTQVSLPTKDHVIICGYGRIGQNIGQFLEKANIPFTALDLDPLRVQNANLAGNPVYYGDAGQYEVLNNLGLQKAKAVVISFSNFSSSEKILKQIRQVKTSIPVIVRGYDERETNLFYEHGATEVIPEALETSLMLASHILLFMKVSAKKVYQWIDESRNNHYDMLRMVFPSHESLNLDDAENSFEGLQSVNLGENTFSIGKTVQSLDLEKLKVKITAVRRENKRFIDPKKDFTLQAKDIVVLYGAFPNLELAKELLILGKNGA